MRGAATATSSILAEASAQTWMAHGSSGCCLAILDTQPESTAHPTHRSVVIRGGIIPAIHTGVGANSYLVWVGAPRYEVVDPRATREGLSAMPLGHRTH